MVEEGVQQEAALAGHLLFCRQRPLTFRKVVHALVQTQTLFHFLLRAEGGWLGLTAAVAVTEARDRG